MYTQTDTDKANRAFLLFLIAYAVFAALCVALLVFALVGRLAWLNALGAFLLAVGSVFLWGCFGIKLIVWRRFLRDLRIGTEHEIDGQIGAIEEETAHKDGLECRAVHLLTGEDSDKAGGRVLYIELSRFPLPIVPGQKIHCLLFGNFIKDLHIEEEAL